MAKARLARVPGRATAIELRQQSVVDLPDRDAFDLAWLPQIFLTPRGPRARPGPGASALRPGCWLVMPVAASDPACTDLERAALEHDAVIRGGGPMSVETATGLLVERAASSRSATCSASSSRWSWPARPAS